jgi:8-oxo-dGTP diphosphatase
MSNSKHWEHPSVTVDVVLVVPREARHEVLLIRRRNPPFEGHWALPGGFVEPNEPLEMAARRELREETGAEPSHLEQLYTFGDPGRDPRGWTISVAHLALLSDDEANALSLQAGDDAGDVGWFDLDDLPILAFDHKDILMHATRRIEAGSGEGNS